MQDPQLDTIKKKISQRNTFCPMDDELEFLTNEYFKIISDYCSILL